MRLNRTLVKWIAPALVATALVVACDPVTVEPTETSARFNVVQDETDPLTFTFDNVSLGDNLTYAWDFGDGSTSTDESPMHTYTAEGDYDVTLTATGDGGADSRSETVTAVDPLSQQKALAGEVSKTWKLAREENSLVVGPINDDGSEGFWWGFGPEGNNKPEERPCLMNDSWTFSLADAKMTYDTDGDVFADDGEFGPWESTVGCYDTSDPEAFVGQQGDLSAWGDGTHDYAYDTDAGTLTVTGTGAFIGIPKVATDSEVKLPQEAVTYSVEKLVNVEDGVDTLVLYANHGGAYWRMTLLSYDNPEDEPDLPEVEDPEDKELEENDIFDAFTGADGASNITWKSDEVTGWATGVANPADGETFLVAQYDKGTSSPYENLQTDLDFRMDLSTRNVFTMRVFLPTTNDYDTVDPNAEDWADPKSLAKTVSVKLQNSTLGGNAFTTQVEIKHTVADEDLGTWVDLTFDFGAVDGASARDDLDRIVIQLGGEGQSQTGTFYLADFKLSE